MPAPGHHAAAPVAASPAAAPLAGPAGEPAAPPPRPARAHPWLLATLRFLLGVGLSAVLAASLVLVVLSVAPPPALRPQPSVPPREPVPAVEAPPPRVESASPAALLAPLDEAVTQIYEAVGPAVVNVTTTAFAYDLFRFAIVPQQGTGSGFLIDDQGHIVTNEHVIRDATELEVTLASGQRLPARLVGRDAITDLAVLRVELPAGTAIRPLPLADSSTVRVGQVAIAIGNPFGFERTITTGVISSVGRTIRTPEGRTMRNVLQTDAAINPGNSGGPLLNARGEAVGINTLIFSPSGGSVGVGFAIASNTARRWLPELIARGRASHPWIGFDAQPVTPQLAQALRLPEPEGLLVATVPPGSPAAQAGLRGGNRQVRVGNQRVIIGGDLVVAVDGQRLTDPEALEAYLEDHKRPGEVVRVDYFRDGQRATAEIRLGERPG